MSMLGGALTRLWQVWSAQGAAGYEEVHWRSLQLFNIFKLVIALVLLGGVLVSDTAVQWGSHDRALFVRTTIAYLIFGVVSVPLIFARWHFNVQIALQVFADIAFVTILIYASRGVTSGLGLLLLTTLAGAGVISRGRLAIFYAAMASIAVLLEQGYEVLVFQESPAQFLQAGFLCVGFFATALVAQALAKLSRENQAIAERAAQRDIDMANQSEVNRLVIRDMPDGVVVVDGAGVIRQMNTQAEAFLGPLHGRSGVYLTDHAPAVAAYLARWRTGTVAQGTGQAVTIDEHHGLRFVAVGERPEAGAVIFLEDLTRAREHAQQMKLASMGRLTANIAHEIRNPLASISHAAQLLQEQPEVGVEPQVQEQNRESMQRLASIIYENTQRLNRMVNDVLGLNRGKGAEPKVLSLASQTDRFIAQFAETEGVEAVVFEAPIAPELTVYFDPTHLHQVLWNLCSNALRHCRRVEGSIRIVARVVRGGRAVKLDVMDDGPGVTESVRGTLFEPFVTGSAQGTGLGLYIARDLCAANGATLDYVNTGVGAHFTIVCRAGEPGA